MNLVATGKHNLSKWLSRHQFENWSQVASSEICPVAFDFEFTRLPLPLESQAQWLSRVEVLSIGMAPAGDLPTLYASVKVTPSLFKLCSTFTRENVVPLIEKRPKDAQWETDAGFYSIVSSYWSELEEQAGKPLLMVCDYQGDAYLLIQQMGLQTPRIAGADMSIGSVAHPQGSWDGLIRHNALDDAIYLRRALGFAPADIPAAA